MRNQLYRSILLFITMVSIIVFTFFSYITYSINIIPLKYFLTGYFIIFIFYLIFIYLINFSKKNIIKNIFSFILILFDIIFIILSFYINDTYHFLSNLTAKKEYLSYSVVTLKDTYKYQDLNNKNIGYLFDDSSDLLKANVEKDLDVQFIEYTDIFKLYSDLTIEKIVDAFVIDSELLSLLDESEENLYDVIEVIYTFDLEIDLKVNDEDNDVTSEPFILYISGIDQYGDLRTTRGRSDVNILAVVNPRTNKILLMNTPRDYYVQLSGTTGLRDKLTHAGIYGIDKSISTLEELYEIDIDYYIRINFNTLVTLIDLIGGVDIESDASFTCHTNRNVHIEKGWNHLDGAAALAYSRERYAYIDGDHHRGRNQEQVITAVINKVSTTPSLLTKYGSIMAALSNSFQTDMATDTITSFVKHQIEYMPKWEIESSAVTGFNSMDYTYSMGTGYKLYVMEPDYESVNQAKLKMAEVYGQ